MKSFATNMKAKTIEAKVMMQTFCDSYYNQHSLYAHHCIPLFRKSDVYRSVKEERLRHKDKQKLKEKELPPLINEQLEPVKKRSKLVLPAPQVRCCFKSKMYTMLAPCLAAYLVSNSSRSLGCVERCCVLI